MLQTQTRVQNNGHWIVFVAVLVSGLVAAFYLYSIDKYSLVYYGDAVSHMLGARKLVDWSENPGLAQLGTVWLPLPHFLLLPFTLIDPLFTTGFAGVAVSLPSIAITAALLYKMIRIHLGDGLTYAAFAGALLYALNPNVFYLGLTAMTEASFMLFFVASAYFIQKWYRNQQAVGNIALCSIFAALATLCRYEGWILPLFVVPLAVVMMARGKSETRKKIYTISLSFVAFAGIVFWVAYNQYQYGDPLEFANQEYYSAASQALDRDIRETLFLQPANVTSVYGITAIMVYGPVLLVVSVLGYTLHRRLGGRRHREILHTFLALPPLFTLVSLLIGIGEMNFWFNSRFLILLAPLTVVLAAIFLQNLPKIINRNKGLVAVVIGALFVFQLSTPAFGMAVTYLDASSGFFYRVNPAGVETGETLSSMYDGGTIMIMTGAAQGHRIMVTSGIQLKQFDEMLESTTWKKSFSEPWLYDKWIVIGKEPGSDAASIVKYWQDRRAELDVHYKTVFENQYYEIMVMR